MKPYYDDGSVTIYHGDCRDVDAWLSADVLVTDPPYGIDYESGHAGTLPRSIEGDEDTTLRDWALCEWGDRPALVFGTWRIPRPAATRMVLVWDTKGALGMGDLSLPWKPAHQEIYVLGNGFEGHRTSDVLCYAPVQSSAWRGRKHPHEKPVPLMIDLIAKTRGLGTDRGLVADPFMGAGATLVAAKQLGRRAIGIEIVERYCEIAARSCSQEVLAF